MKRAFNKTIIKTISGKNNDINCFEESVKGNIDKKVIDSFGHEWDKFQDFDDKEIDRLGRMYFDILNDEIINKDTYCLDIGCGTGRWSKYLLDKIGFMELMDPSDAIFTADKLIGKRKNVRLSKVSIDNIPFADESFDFAMSIGVLHHIPNTEKAMIDCVKKVKKGGYFYTYLYYNLDNKGLVFKSLLNIVTVFRKVISLLPNNTKLIVCDIIAVVVYMPFILFGRFLRKIKLKNVANRIPLNIYQNQSFFIIRNDALDRFGTSLEQRFSKEEIILMMEKAGLREIVVSDSLPYWHAVGKRMH